MSDPEKIASSHNKESERTGSGKFTARFKNPVTGENDEESTENDKEVKEKVKVVSQKNEQLDPLERIQKDFQESETAKNFVKIKLYKSLLYIVLPIFGILSATVCGFWIYQLSNLAGPTSSNTTEIGTLKTVNGSFESRIKSLEDRLYNLVNERGQTVNSINQSANDKN